MADSVVLSPATLTEIRAAQGRLTGSVVRSPLIRLNADAPARIYLKLENLQPIGSFKLRGAGNAIAQADAELLRRGLWTASAGNMAQAVAWYARQLSVDCTVVVPNHAPTIKLEAITRLGARPIKVPVARWLDVFRTREFEGMDGVFVHPFSDAAVIAGNGTIGIEIVEDLPQVDAVVVPYGGGGLACGIASAMRALRPEAKVFASEVSSAAPLAPSMAAGHPVTVEYAASFVDGIGTPSLFPEMWGLARRLLAGSIVVSLEQIASAIRLLVERHHIVAEGAGGCALAAALTGDAGNGVVVCVVSGGNLDVRTLTTILNGRTPG
jgi:threonine dehydratase